MDSIFFQLSQQIEQDKVVMIEEACDMIETLNDIKIKILQYVEGRMTLISPNLTIILGSTVAAKLMGVLGVGVNI